MSGNVRFKGTKKVWIEHHTWVRKRIVPLGVNNIGIKKLGSIQIQTRSVVSASDCILVTHPVDVQYTSKRKRTEKLSLTAAGLTSAR